MVDRMSISPAGKLCVPPCGGYWFFHLRLRLDVNKALLRLLLAHLQSPRLTLDNGWIQIQIQ
jgi:hypothetical protein